MAVNHQRKGTHMRHALIAMVLAATLVLIAAGPAQAMYRDGPNMYQYVRSSPGRYVDWNGAQAAEPAPAQVPVTVALYGDYPAEGGFAGWAAKVAKDRNYKIAVGADVIKQLQEASKKPPNCCIKKLFIFHHAYEYREHSGSYVRNKNQYPDSAPLSAVGTAADGLMVKKPDEPAKGAADLADLQAAIANKTIRFCSPCSIVMTGCRMAETKFPAALAATMGCTVTAAHGASSPELEGPEGKKRETGRWSSAPKYHDEGEKEPYTGWEEFSPAGTSKQTGRYIRVWGE